VGIGGARNGPALATLVLAAALASGAAAQDRAAGGVVSAVMEVDLTDPRGSAVVEVTYSLAVPAAVSEVPLTVLSPQPVAVEDLVVEGAEGPWRVDLPLSETVQRTGVARVAPADSARQLELRIGYSVRGAAAIVRRDVRYVVPVVAVDWPPPNPLPGTFRASVRLPRDMVAFEAFPTALAGFGGGAADAGAVALELSVLPAYVSLRARRGGAPVVTIPRVVDGSLIALLLVMGLVGWRKMREVLQ